MPYMCLACSEVYDDSFDVCPKVGCNATAYDDEIIYVDEMFAPVLSMLNKKGYEIKDSHFGNPNNNMTGDPYIALRPFLIEEYGKERLKTVFNDIPCPWRVIIKDDSPVITCYICDIDKIERFKKLLSAHIKLADFVKKMPEIDD